MLIEIKNKIEELEKELEIKKQEFINLINSFNSLDSLKDFFTKNENDIKQFPDLANIFFNKKTLLLKQIKNTILQNNDNNIPDFEYQEILEFLTLCNDYQELKSLYKRFINQIKSNNTLYSVYKEKEEEILFNRAKTAIISVNKDGLDNLLSKIYSTITKKEYKEVLEIITKIKKDNIDKSEEELNKIINDYFLSKENEILS
jgi:hypothetical protein